MNPETDRRGQAVLECYQRKAGLEGANQRRERERCNVEHRSIVEAGGGEYVPGMLGDLVLFNSKQTRSTLALPEKSLTAEAVALKILTSNRQFGK